MLQGLMAKLAASKGKPSAMSRGMGQQVSQIANQKPKKNFRSTLRGLAVKRKVKGFKQQSNNASAIDNSDQSY